VSRQSYIKYLEKLPNFQLKSSNVPQDVPEVLTKSFLGLDNDLSKEATSSTSTTYEAMKMNMMKITVAMSGCVAAVAHVRGSNLYVPSIHPRSILTSSKETDSSPSWHHSEPSVTSNSSGAAGRWRRPLA